MAASPTVSASAAALAVASTYPSSVRLADGSNFPLASFGLQIYDDAMAEKLTLQAIDAGFRNFFASVLARNQVGFARAVERSGVPREQLYICGSVVSNRAVDEQTAYEFTKLGLQENLQAFAAGGITTLDMIMLDYPGPDEACIRGQWRAFEEFKAAGKARCLAVSNFSPQQVFGHGSDHMTFAGSTPLPSSISSISSISSPPPPFPPPPPSPPSPPSRPSPPREKLVCSPLAPPTA
uniref:NADP-dependent oxidoreductase domain-containing protein n=1 Tax=Haptolina brevifila TaxID=156173 RepID=A0A7S2H0M0_9EUKA